MMIKEEMLDAEIEFQDKRAKYLQAQGWVRDFKEPHSPIWLWRKQIGETLLATDTETAIQIQSYRVMFHLDSEK